MSFQSMSGRARRGQVWAVALGVGLVGALVVGIVAASTAGNTVEETRAGIGEGTVTGYDVSSVHYTLNAADPSRVDAVAFSLDTAPPAGGTLRVKLSTTSTTWYDCTVAGTSASCPTTSPPASVADVSELVVVAAQ